MTAVARRSATHDLRSRPISSGASPRHDSRTAPELVVVPRRRRAAGFVVTLSVLVVGVMLAGAVLHTALAERQLRIDRLERSVQAEQDRFDVLRRQRAELRSPARLAAEARTFGMEPATATEFVPVAPIDLARAIAATGNPRTATRLVSESGPLDQFRLVKSVANEEP